MRAIAQLAIRGVNNLAKNVRCLHSVLHWHGSGRLIMTRMENSETARYPRRRHCDSKKRNGAADISRIQTKNKRAVLYTMPLASFRILDAKCVVDCALEWNFAHSFRRTDLSRRGTWNRVLRIDEITQMRIPRSVPAPGSHGQEEGRCPVMAASAVPLQALPGLYNSSITTRAGRCLFFPTLYHPNFANILVLFI